MSPNDTKPAMDGERLIRRIKSVLGASPPTDPVKEDILAYIADAAGAEARNFFVRCHKRGLNGALMLYETMIWLIERGKSETAERISGSALPESPHWAVYLIGRAMLAFARFDGVTGTEFLRDGLLALKGAAAGLPDDDFRWLTANLFLMEGAVHPLRDRCPEPEFEVIHSAPYADSPFTCCAVCDDAYFRDYARGFVGTLRENCGETDVFLLLVNPSEAVVSEAVSFEGVRVARVAYGGRWTAEFCAAARFILANSVLDAAGGPVVFMDIDGIFPEGSGEILKEIAARPLSVVSTGYPFPTRMISAAVVGARPGAEARGFFDFAGDCALRDLARSGPIWMLDQTALYRAVCEGRKNGWDITELNGLFAGAGKIRLPDFFTAGHVASQQSREMRRSNAFYNLRLSDRGNAEATPMLMIPTL